MLSPRGAGGLQQRMSQAGEAEVCRLGSLTGVFSGGSRDGRA